MLSWHVHYLNKFPDGHVQSSENSVDVYDAKGAHVIAIRKDGAGSWVDQSEMFGLSGKHDLSAIPKDARVHKIVDGKIGFDEKAEERKKLRAEFAEDGKILSCIELKAKGFEFDEKQRKVK